MKQQVFVFLIEYHKKSCLIPSFFYLQRHLQNLVLLNCFLYIQRNDHNVLTLSDRDVIHNNKGLKDLSGTKSLQNKIIDTFNNFKPDLLVLGHADRVSTETLNRLKEIDKNIKMCQWFLDPLSKHGPDHINNSKPLKI